MVPDDPRSLLEHILRNSTLLSRGAESEIRLGLIKGIMVVFKVRTPKSYMHPKLDSMLRTQRTIREARIIAHARASGVPAPRLVMVLPSLGLLAIEYVYGHTLRDLLIQGQDDAYTLAFEAGAILGRLHKSGIVHGDPTTSNYIVSKRDGRLILIDYGLSEFSDTLEDRAVDLHLFRRAAEATHPDISELLVNGFYDGYKSVLGVEADRVIGRAREIALMGRYVEERRTVWRVDST